LKRWVERIVVAELMLWVICYRIERSALSAREGWRIVVGSCLGVAVLLLLVLALMGLRYMLFDVEGV